MIGELNTAVTGYQNKWASLMEGRQNKGFFESLRPTAVAWKAEDLDDFNARFAYLRDVSDQIHLGWVNERWLATFHLRDTSLALGISVVKLMQRRPGSTDATGLDHVDFYFKPESLPQDAKAKDILEEEPNLEWSEEFNGDHCQWLSVWFEGTEAKLRNNTTVDVCIDELRAVANQITAEV